MKNKKIKIFTYVDRPNSVFLKYWISFYSKIPNSSLSILYRNHLGKLNIENDSVEIIDVSSFFKGKYINQWIPPIEMYNFYQKKFLNEFDILIFSDLDEFIVHDDLIELINCEFKNPLVTNGIEIVQNIDFEKKFDFYSDITSQRNYMIRSNWYDKPLILSSEIKWNPGLHNNNHYEKKIDNLYLIHLGRICKEEYVKMWSETKILYPNSVSHFIGSIENHYDINFGKSNEIIPENIKKFLNNILI